MVLYNTINERFKSVLGYGDDGKYLEERVLLNQMSMFIDIKTLDEYFLSLLNYVKERPLNDEEKFMLNNNLWAWIGKEFDEIMPTELDFNQFKNTFESKQVAIKPNDRLAKLQQVLITYFIESLKAKVLDGIITEEESSKALEEYQEQLITPNSAILDKPEMNLGLDDSINFYDIKLEEYKCAIPKNNVK